MRLELHLLIGQRGSKVSSRGGKSEEACELVSLILQHHRNDSGEAEDISVEELLAGEDSRKVWRKADCTAAFLLLCFLPIGLRRHIIYFCWPIQIKPGSMSRNSTRLPLLESAWQSQDLMCHSFIVPQPYATLLQGLCLYRPSHIFIARACQDYVAKYFKRLHRVWYQSTLHRGTLV